MKKLLLTGLVGLGLVVGANASSERDTTINFYGVGAKTDKNQNSSAGAGIMFDSEEVKVKLEATSDFIKTGAVLKFNPIANKWYIKVGANYINQKMYAPDDTNAKVNQYSGALATGYMFMKDLYVEFGGSYTELDGAKIGADYELKDETTSLAYLEVAKRWENSFGTIDTTANAGQVNHEFVDNEFSYGVGVDYYPTNNSKLGYNYQNEKNNIANTYSAQYGYFFAEYVDNISTETYQVNAGIKIAFSDITDLSTYKMPMNIKPHLSELHRFENVAFGTNMEIQSSGGVSKTDEAVARDNTPAISTPTINAIATQNVNDNGGGLATTLLTVSGTNINAGAVFSIVADPTAGGLTINSSTGVLIYDANINGFQTYSITVKVLNTDGGSDTETFTLNVTDNA